MYMLAMTCGNMIKWIEAYELYCIPVAIKKVNSVSIVSFHSHNHDTCGCCSCMHHHCYPEYQNVLGIITWIVM